MTIAQQLRSRAKSGARHMADRVLSPYFDSQTAQISQLLPTAPAVASPPAAAALPLELTDFNTMLHTLRTVELARMVTPERVLLSVGCSDRSYFDWIESGHGPVPEHWGVELYRPQPADLPENVRWIVGSAASMPGIPDASVDVVFSGQNIEHLPQADLLGFLLESHRVLRPGGHVVVDSPNRLVTEPLAWRHPEHVIELSPAEAQELVELAGFEVTACRGYWLCAEADGTVLPLLPDGGGFPEYLRRVVLAADRPEQSFCWWLEARRTESEVDAAALSARVAQLVAQLWDDRVNRGAWAAGPATDGVHRLPAGTAGMVYRAGPFPVFPGTSRVTVSSAAVQADDQAADQTGGLVVRLVDSEGAVLAEGTGAASLPTDETIFGVWAEVAAREPLSNQVDIRGVHVRPAP